MLKLARYVHANYRFIVAPQGEYHAQAVDADEHLDWSKILQIIVSARSQSTNCPICLSTPVAPRMAKCGHIFCLPCLIRYMHSTDDAKPVPEKKTRWKKCPICWDSIYISETRPVRWFTGQEGETPQEGGDVVLRLISRQSGSTLALPRDGAESLSKSEDIPWYFAAEVMDYARVMKGSEEYMLSQFDIEIQDLQSQEKEDELLFGDDVQWTRRSVAAIMRSKEDAKGIGNPSTASKQPTKRKEKRPLVREVEADEDAPEYYFVQQTLALRGSSNSTPQTPGIGIVEAEESDKLSMSDGRSSSSSSSFNRNRCDTLGPNSQTSSESVALKSQSHLIDTDSNQQRSGEQHFFFYQALLHCYLSPLDIRILKTAFGEFSSFPSTILPRVERVSTGHIIDDELRRRAKYLGHLPHGREITFLECDWTDVVAPEVLEKFTLEIDRRRKKNREKEVREEKARVRAEKEEEDKRWAAARRKRPSLSHGSPLSTDFEPAIVSEDQLGGLSFDVTTASSSPPWKSFRVRNGSAFASLASPSTSPEAPRTVWGTAAVVPGSPPLQAAVNETEPSENDGWLQGWERDLLHEDGLVAQVQAASIEGVSQTGPASGPGKKKKNKKITLMTTNARRGA